MLAGSFLFTLALSAQTPVYFPLEVGNTWLYRAVSIDVHNQGKLIFYTQSISVRGKEKIGSNEYFDVSYFGRDLLLRMEPSTGNVLVYDQAAGAELPWMSLGLPVGGTFDTSLNPCPTTGEIIDRNSNVAVQAGDFTDEIQVDFQSSCPDTKVTRQYYAPNVGLIRDEEATSAGKLAYLLLYYDVGGATVSGSEFSFTMALDSSRYFPGGVLGARLTLRNTAFSPVQVHFPSGQSFDLKILNDKGTESLYTWSSDKTFATIARDVTLNPGEVTYGLTVPLQDIPPGRYVAQGCLTTDPPTSCGTVSFEIGPIGKP